MSLKASVSFLASLCALTACTSATLTGDIDQRIGRAQQQHASQSLPVLSNQDSRTSPQSIANTAAKQLQPSVFKQSQRSWLGSDLVPVNSDDKLPDFFSKRYSMAFADQGKAVDLSTVASRLTDMLGVTVRLSADVYDSRPTLQSLDLPVVNRGSEPSKPSSLGQAGQTGLLVRMDWNGTLTDFLNSMTERFNLSWEYANNTITIRRFMTEFYQLAAYPNGFTYNMSSGGAGTGGGSGGGQSSGQSGGAAGSAGAGGGTLAAPGTFNVSESGALDGQKSLLEIIRKLAAEAPGSEVMVSDGTGRIVVRSTKEIHGKIRDLIRLENENLLKQVHIQIDLYSLTSNATDQRGVDWAAFYRSLSDRYNIQTRSPATLVGAQAGVVTFTSQSDRWVNSNAVVQALYEIGDSVQHRPISLVALNRQWARKARLNSTGYLSQTTAGQTNALGGGAAVPGLQTSSIVTGDQFAVMPYVLQNNTVMLKVGISLSDLISLLSVSTGSGVTLQQVQTPNTSSLADQFTVALQPGEVIAITGLSRDSSTTNDRRLSEGSPILAGGSKNINRRTENFIVFIRTVVL